MSNNESYSEIDIIRAFVTVVLVLFHSLCPYLSWGLADGMYDSKCYSILASFTYTGMLETFTCISGFLFGIFLFKKQGPFSNLILKKTFRLLIPCWTWGFLYSYLFTKDLNIWHVINGIGHLWYLPMLFGVFIIDFIIQKNHNKNFSKTILLVLALIYVLPFPTLPLHINNSLYYLFFFHLGIELYKTRNYITQLLQRLSPYYLVLPLIISFVYVLLTMYCIESPNENQAIIHKAGIIFIRNILRSIAAATSILFYWKIAFEIQKLTALQKVFSTIARYSFGIYILQEFFLRFIYYDTNLSTIFTNLTPWVAFPLVVFLAFLGSIALNNKKTRFLIGG